MKKVLIFILILILIGSVFVCSIFAADPYIQPLYGSGFVERSGWWSPVTYNIGGTFGLYEDYPNVVEYPISSPWRILRDDRDENGDGLCFWILEVSVPEKFAFVDDVYEFYDALSVFDFHYDTIQIVLRSYDQEPRGYLNDFNILGSDAAGNSFRTVLFHTSSGTDPASDVYLLGSGLYFGDETNRRLAPSDGWTLEFRQRFMFYFFSGYQTTDGIYGGAGLFKPVVYTVNWPGDDSGGGSGGGSGGSGSGDSPAVGFTSFMRLIIDAFEDLLMIDFFGGFFSLADILGVIVTFALLVLFVKWFAGG